jgi:hypothetical protein
MDALKFGEPIGQYLHERDMPISFITEGYLVNPIAHDSVKVRP